MTKDTEIGPDYDAMKEKIEKLEKDLLMYKKAYAEKQVQVQNLVELTNTLIEKIINANVKEAVDSITQ